MSCIKDIKSAMDTSLFNKEIAIHRIAEEFVYLPFFLEKAEDAEIKTVIEYALELSKKHIVKLTSIFTEEKCAIPHGFKMEEDVDLNAPRLYSDNYVLNFVLQMSMIGLTTYAASLSGSTRAT
jgi:hypothetical protein